MLPTHWPYFLELLSNNFCEQYNSVASVCIHLFVYLTFFFIEAIFVDYILKEMTFSTQKLTTHLGTGTPKCNTLIQKIGKY